MFTDPVYNRVAIILMKLDGNKGSDIDDISVDKIKRCSIVLNTISHLELMYNSSLL